MPRDRKYPETVTLRLTEEQKETVEYLSDEMDESISGVFRNLLFVMNVLYSDNVALADALKPIPEIVNDVSNKETITDNGDSNTNTSVTSQPDNTVIMSCDSCSWSYTSDQPDEALDAYQNHDCNVPTVSN